MTPTLLGLLVLLVGTPLNLIVTAMLWRRSLSNPKIRVLRERAVAATVMLLEVLVFGLVFFNNDSLPPPIDLTTTKWVTRAAMAVLAIVPAVYWLILYRTASRKP